MDRNAPITRAEHDEFAHRWSRKRSFSNEEKHSLQVKTGSLHCKGG